MALTLNLLTLRLFVGCRVWTTWQPDSSAFSSPDATPNAAATAHSRIYPSKPYNPKQHRRKRSC